MLNTLPHPTYRRWAIFYAATAALLAGWLLLEKMPDGREELAGSVENAFRRSGEAMERSNSEMLIAIQDAAEYEPIPQFEDYKNRAVKALAWAEAFENHREEEGLAERLSALKDSFILLSDRDDASKKAMEELVDSNRTSDYHGVSKKLRTNQLLASSHAMTSWVLNYCAQHMASTGWHFIKLVPGYQTSVHSPTAGEAFQAEIILTAFGAPTERRCADLTFFFNDHPIPIKEGSAPLRTTFPAPGLHTLRLRFRRERCRDGSVTEVSRDFTVNVLERCDTND